MLLNVSAPHWEPARFLSGSCLLSVIWSQYVEGCSEALKPCVGLQWETTGRWHFIIIKIQNTIATTFHKTEQHKIYTGLNKSTPLLLRFCNQMTIIFILFGLMYTEMIMAIKWKNTCPKLRLIGLHKWLFAAMESQSNSAAVTCGALQRALLASAGVCAT